MSAPGCPWENGYQESFFKGFKLDLGDPNRFDTLGELVAVFAERCRSEVVLKDLEKVS